MSLCDFLCLASDRFPEKTALIFGDLSWTYREFDEITSKIAAALIKLGIQKGEAIALLFTNSPELVFCYYACFKIGAIAVPINHRLKGPEMEYIINHCGARICISQATLFPELDRVRRLLSLVEHYYIAGDASQFTNVIPFAELLKQVATNIIFPTVNPADVAAILYTSGTTARPKGVTHTHHTLTQTAAYFSQQIDLSGDDVTLGMLLFCHIFGLALQLITGVSVGATIAIVPQVEPSLVLSAIAQHGVTILYGLPVMYSALVNYPMASDYNLSSLKLCLAGGDAVTSSLQQQFQATFGLEITEGCGMTEVVPYTMNPTNAEKRIGSIGKASLGMSLRLSDERGRDVPVDEVGEILVKSEAVMAGYWQNPELTAATVRDGWLRTGDLARMDADGYYWFVGRQKEIIVRGDENVSPLEVEAVLYQHPAVKEAAVIGVPDEIWGEVVWACVALHPGKTTTEVELQAFVQDKMADYNVPEAIAFFPELPKGLTGKIHRKTLKDLAIVART